MRIQLEHMKKIVELLERQDNSFIGIETSVYGDIFIRDDSGNAVKYDCISHGFYIDNKQSETINY